MQLYRILPFVVPDTPMHILIDQGGPELLNLGDRAMAQVCLERLQQTFPHARCSILASDPIHTKRCLPTADFVPHGGRMQFFDRTSPAARLLLNHSTLELRTKLAYPNLLLSQGRRFFSPEVNQFLLALRSADLVVSCGGGFFTDKFDMVVRRVGSTLRLAQRLGKPTALFGQGLGPMTQPRLLRLTQLTLRNAKLLALREPRQGPAFAASVGVSPENMLVTGDDAIEMAYSRSTPLLTGTALGVNLRSAWYADLSKDTLAPMAQVLSRFLAQRSAPWTGLPVSHNENGEDLQTLRDLGTLIGLPPQSLGEDLLSPEALIDRTASCRVVLTGSYHAAVFALAQGIPTIGVTNSAYYDDKFLGLQSLFGQGIQLLRLSSPDWPQTLESHLNSLWSQAPDLRPALLASAQNQSQLSRAAYARLPAILFPKKSPHNPRSLATAAMI